MPRNIRNTRRNFARPSDTFTPASTFSTVSFVNGFASSSVNITKKSNPVGPSGNGSFIATSSPAGVSGTANTTATTVSIALDIASTAAQTSTISITESNYNGTGKPVQVPVNLNSGVLISSSVLVIGGGAGAAVARGNAANGWMGITGGGGAGAYREFSNYLLTTGVNIPVTVGAGGATGDTTPGYAGSTSTFHTINAGGGGGSGWGFNTSASTGAAGNNGGSGGGGGGNSRSDSGNLDYAGGSGGTPTSPAIVTNKELYTITGGAGRLGTIRSTGNGWGGGGGGASGPATTAAGAAGRASTITGSSVFRAGGGAAGGDSGGSGGGGTGGADSAGGNGAVNTGSGGGGAYSSNDTQRAGGAGGSGVVIIRYPNTYTITIGAGLTGSTSTTGSDKVTTITAGTGNVSFA